MRGLLLHALFPCAALLPALSLPAAHPRRPGAPSPLSAPQRLVAEARIWGANNGINGYAFLPVTVHGHQATVVINLNYEGDLSLSPAALTRIGVSLADTTTRLDALGIGADVQHNVPLRIIRKQTWTVHGPDGTPEVVGIVGVHFLTTHYDVLYDFPHRRVRLYAFPPYPGSAAWLPPGIKGGDCGKLVPVPPGAATFTGMAITLDGHPVTGVIEMMPYFDPRNDGHDEKMNESALQALHLPAYSPRIRPIPGQHFIWHGRRVEDEVDDVHLAIGHHAFWTGPVKVFPILDVEAGLPSHTPVMLLNLTTIHDMVLYNSVSGGRVCLRAP